MLSPNVSHGNSMPIRPPIKRSVSFINTFNHEAIPTFVCPPHFIGESTYRQTVVFLLMIACNRLFPDQQLIVQSNYGFSLDKRSYLCRFEPVDLHKKLKTQRKSKSPPTNKVDDNDESTGHKDHSHSGHKHHKSHKHRHHKKAKKVEKIAVTQLEIYEILL